MGILDRLTGFIPSNHNGELVIHRHSFENAKKEIKKFGEEAVTDLDLERVKEFKDLDDFFFDILTFNGIGLDHVVTGAELNDLTSQIQKVIHSIHNTQLRTIKEFLQVYIALEALDKDYIQAILVTVNENKKISESIKVQQEQIKKTVDNQKKTVDVLDKFKQKLDSYAHLDDVDSTWNTVKKHTEQLIEIEKQNGGIVNSVQKNRESIRQVQEEIAKIIESQWKTPEELKKFKQKLDGYAHLDDVDSTWNTVKKHTEQLIEIEKQNGGIANSIQKNKDDVEEKIAAAIRERNSAIDSLTKKIKYAYLLAGGAAVLAIIEMLLLLL